jgi:hypothetical protein
MSGRLLAVIALVFGVGCGQVVKADAGPGDGDAAEADASSGDVDAAGDCGNGSVDTGEDCDEGAANGTAGSCCADGCAFAAATTTCRAAAGGCDVAETCTGSSPTCPADDHEPDTTACTAGLADTCCGGACVIGNGACTCTLADPGALTITIIESTSMGAWAVMDAVWRDQAIALGHTATIVPQTTLDAVANLAATDVLIVPAGAIAIPANRITTIQAFVASGRGAYLSGEYQASMTSNQGFASIVGALGGSFTWGADVVGEQQPVEVVGCNASVPATTPPITDFYYAATGSGTGVEVIVRKTTGGTPFGWSFCRAGGGMIMNVTDADFIWRLNPVEFMTNVITRLGDAATCDQ